MIIKQYQVDAFATQVFKGNPAAICPLNDWLEDAILQAIAEENNLSETAFFVPNGRAFELRWFTPVSEVKLCGHATLATAHVIFEELGYTGTGSTITFKTLSGDLLVSKQGSLLQMDFPATQPVACEVSETLVKGLGVRPIEVLAADDYIAVFDSEAVIRSIKPSYELLEQLDLRGVIITAPSDEVDFVSRFFAPKLGVKEDPVTGSAHCELAPYWANKMGKTTLIAKQISKRGGTIGCEIVGNRVFLSGSAITFMKAEIYI